LSLDPPEARATLAVAGTLKNPQFRRIN